MVFLPWQHVPLGVECKDFWHMDSKRIYKTIFLRRSLTNADLPFLEVTVPAAFKACPLSLVYLILQQNHWRLSQVCSELYPLETYWQAWFSTACLNPVHSWPWQGYTFNKLYSTLYFQHLKFVKPKALKRQYDKWAFFFFCSVDINFESFKKRLLHNMKL